MEPLQPQLFEITLTLLSAVVSLVLLPLLRQLGKQAAVWLEAKTHMASFACATEKLTLLVTDAVLDIEQSFVKQMKAQGKWDANTMAMAKSAAAEGAKRALGSKGVDEVLKCLDITGSELNHRIGQMIESFLAVRKQ